MTKFTSQFFKFSLLLLISQAAMAATVSGKVFRADSIKSTHYSVTFTNDRHQRFSASIDHHGGYEIQHLEPGRYSAASAVLNYGYVSLPDLDVSGDTAINFHVTRSGKEVTIMVHNQEDIDLSNLNVYALKDDGPWVGYMQAIHGDHDSHDFHLPIDPGTYEFVAESPNWSGNALRLVVTDDRPPRTVHIYSTAGSNPALTAELLNMLDRDQLARNGLDKLSEQAPGYHHALKQIRKTDRTNQARFGEILEEFGWPDANLVGLDGTDAAYLILQHGPPCTTGEFLPLLQRMADAGQLAWQSVAASIDRVLLSQGRNQLYGTQFGFDDQQGLFLKPVESVDMVDARRNELGMEPLEVYQSKLRKIYGVSDQ